MKHGYTNSTERCGATVVKTYDGPDLADRAAAELHALTRLDGVFPVPPVMSATPRALTTRFVGGEHGQDLIEAGHADEVLAACGRQLRRLHALDPRLIVDEADGDLVIQHGDFGPNNVLFDPADMTVTAVLDWEFCDVGPAITDLAWCEWIVRMHHPKAVGAIDAFFDSYGTRPSWTERRAEMLRRCAWLEDFTRRWDPTGPGAALWQQRAQTVARWSPRQA